MNETMWKREDMENPQLTPTWARYTEAMNKFTTSATAFMEHVHLLTEARDAYQEAMTASAALRNRLDTGDQTLRSLRTQLAQVVNDHLDQPAVESKKPELVKGEATRTTSQNTGTGRTFP